MQKAGPVCRARKKKNMNAKKILCIAAAVAALTVPSMAYAGADVETAVATEAVAEKTCDVVITEIGPNKVKVVKALRTVLDVELKVAYEMTQKTPSTVATGIAPELAAKLKAELEAAGATVAVKEK